MFYGSTYRDIDGKKTQFFDGGFLYNPYIPDNVDYPIIYSSFKNDIDYQSYIPLYKKKLDAATKRSSLVVTVPVGKVNLSADHETMDNLIEEGYQQTKRLLYRK